MFARIVSMRLKPNISAEFSQTIEKKILPVLRKHKGFRDEMTFLSTDEREAVAISLWDSREQSEAYASAGYPEVLKELNNLIDGTPRVQAYNVTTSTPHNIVARPAA